MRESDMAIAQTDGPTLQKPLGLWPGVVMVVLRWLDRFVVPVLVPAPAAKADVLLGGLLGATPRVLQESVALF